MNRNHHHITLSIQPGYIDTTYPLHNSADIRMVQEHDYKCISCGKVLGGNHWVNNEVCWTETIKEDPDGKPKETSTRK